MMKHSPLLRRLAVLALTVFPITGWSAPLWQIGKPDNSTAEFALAPDGNKSFSTPGAFVVGVSDAGKDWPYIQPGPSDKGWAPTPPYTSRIWFALSALPREDSTLVLDFADTHQSGPPKLRVGVNGFTSEHETPAGNGGYAKAAGGREHVVKISIPPSALRVGVNEIQITGIEGSWVLWDAVAFEAGRGARLADVGNYPSTFVESVNTTIEVLKSKDGNPVRRANVDIVHLGHAVSAELTVGPSRKTVSLVPGINRLTIEAPEVDAPTKYPVSLRVGSKIVNAPLLALDKAREWTVYLIPQTHLDIGFTHFQEDVLARQVEHFRTALKLIEKTKGYPEGERFVWHPEGMWAVEEFLRVATPAERGAFLEACRNRTIHLDGLYAQAMTGLFHEEELMELIASAKHFERKYGVTIDSAMQSDVPGYTWGLTTALVANGIRQMTVAPNVRHRIGRVLTWGDRPFHWETPDGRDRVLFWMTSKGYSMFRYATENPTTPEECQLFRKMPDVLAMLADLEREPDYPYDMLMLRYAIGADNGPPDPMLCEVVHEWNKTHFSPRFVISTNSGFLRKFEEKYGKDLPVRRGDYTPYWEDGAASTSKATATNREAKERLVQAQVLWSMRDFALPLHDRVDAAWTKAILYDEHTWGAHNSISAPDSEFAIRQDAYKQAYAFDAAKQARELIESIVPPRDGLPTIDVSNTTSWTRSGLVTLTKEQSKAGHRVRDEKGQVVPSQRLASGELAFLARDVPAFGTRRYTIEAGAPADGGSAHAQENTLSNETLEVTVDPKTGAISSLKRKDTQGDWVDVSKGAGLNDYLYILGRNPDEGRSTISSPVSITVEDPGPLVATLKIESGAPGAKLLTRRVRLIDGMDHVEIINIVDKLKVRDPEGVYFGFPFNLPGATPRVDTPWASVEVETGQLPGANRNFYCVQRFIDLANNDRGVTWVTVDAPLVQFDPIRISPYFDVEAFRAHIDPAPFLWSWTMNNHWETNYKADQEGEITFRYAIRPYVGGYDAAAAERFGRGITQPLLAAPVDPDTPVPPPLLTLDGDAGIVATQVRPSRDGKAWMIRLFNTSGHPASTRLVWHRPVGTIHISNPMEDALEPASEKIELASRQVVTLRVERLKNDE